MKIKLQAITHSEWTSLSDKPEITLGIHPSPWGNCIISQIENSLCGLSFQNINQDDALQSASLSWPGSKICYNEATTAHWVPCFLDYLTGKPLQSNTSLLLLGTPFQLSVWTALLTIPTGQVTSYQNIANKIGRSNAVRAVGTAIGKNKISILVPCHRVIQSSGSLGGYAWGLPLKRTLLDYEALART